MHSHAEALVVVIFPSCISPGGDIKRYYLIELKWGWELTGKFFEVLGGFCVLQQEQNYQTRYVHPSFISTQTRLCWPSAVLGSGAGTHNIDWHIQSGGLRFVWGVAETQREIKKPLIVHCRPGRCCAKAGWFMKSFSTWGSQSFCVCFPYMESVSFNILLTVPLEHDWEVKATCVCPPRAPGQFCHAKAAAQTFFGGAS